MTLLVANIDANNVWMIADSAITGGGIGARQREYALKIQPGTDGRSLVGFSGDQHHGARVINHAASLSGANAVSVLLDSHHACPSVDFAYAYLDEIGPHLFRISHGQIQLANAFCRYRELAQLLG